MIHAINIAVWLVFFYWIGWNIPYKTERLGGTFIICHYAFKGKWICQRKEVLEGKSCAEKLRNFALQNNTLAELLPPGKYSLVTHGTILRRIQAKSNIRVLYCSKHKKSCLRRNLVVMCGCKRCEHYRTCAHLKKCEKIQFYKMKIIKE